MFSCPMYIEQQDFKGLNIMPASVDPMHNGHLMVLRTAESILQEPVHLVIVKNPNKNTGLFNHQERLDIARIFLPKPYEVLSATRNEIIRRALHDSKRIIRGWRSESDGREDEAIMSYYELMDWRQKVFYVNKGNNSSTSLKQLVAEGRIDEACAMTLPEVVDLIRHKLVPLVPTFSGT